MATSGLEERPDCRSLEGRHFCNGEVGTLGWLERWRGPEEEGSQVFPVQQPTPGWSRLKQAGVPSELRSLPVRGRTWQMAGCMGHSLVRMAGAAHSAFSLPGLHGTVARGPSASYIVVSKPYVKDIQKKPRHHALPLEVSQCHFCNVGHDGLYKGGLGSGEGVTVSMLPLGRWFSMCGSRFLWGGSACQISCISYFHS